MLKNTLAGRAKTAVFRDISAIFSKFSNLTLE